MNFMDNQASRYDPPPGAGLCLCDYASLCNICGLHITFWCLEPEDVHICCPICYAEALLLSDAPCLAALKPHIIIVSPPASA